MPAGRAGVMSKPAGGFFGVYPMLREFWAEDPSWTNPGNGNPLTTVRDNGSLGLNLTAATMGTGSAPLFQATGAIGSKPCFEFNATDESNGGYLNVATGANGTTGTLVVVAKLDTSITAAEYFTDSGDGSTTQRAIIGGLSSSWRAYVSATLNVTFSTASPDTMSHFHRMYTTTNRLDYYIDGAFKVNDTSGTSDLGTGFTMGANSPLSGACLDGSIAYVALYAGDLSAQDGFSSWVNRIKNWYGIT